MKKITQIPCITTAPLLSAQEIFRGSLMRFVPRSGMKRVRRVAKNFKFK